VLVGAGVSEAAGSPLLGPGDHERAGIEGPFIDAVDPMAREESILRASLRPGLLRSLAYNASHRNPEVSLFEIGHVFLPADRSAVLPDERELVGAALAGGAAPAKQVLDVVASAFDALVALEAAEAPGLHPTRTARLLVGGQEAGWVGEVDPEVAEAFGIPGRVGWIEADLDLLLPKERRYRAARAVSRHPSSDIDLAFAVDDSAPAAAVEAVLRRAGGELLEEVHLFDVYRLGEGSRSLAYRLRFQAPDRTLTDEDVAEARRRCIEAVESTLPAHLR
jgi:phenylalanyl-tRNA synthetase beta chain